MIYISLFDSTSYHLGTSSLSQILKDLRCQRLAPHRIQRGDGKSVYRFHCFPVHLLLAPSGACHEHHVEDLSKVFSVAWCRHRLGNSNGIRRCHKYPDICHYEHAFWAHNGSRRHGLFSQSHRPSGHGGGGRKGVSSRCLASSWWVQNKTNQ